MLVEIGGGLVIRTFLQMNSEGLLIVEAIVIFLLF